MAQTSWPFESVDTTETQFSQWARNIGEGVKGLPSGTELKPYGDASGMNVKVPAGQAMVRGHYFLNDATATLTVSSANATNPRIDYVVLELDPVANTIVLKMVDGTAAASPVAPALTQTDSGVYQLPLATVYVAAAVSNVAASAVTDMRTFLNDAYRVAQVTPRGNVVINGDFSINQRGFTIATTSSTYGFDRWVLTCSNGTTTYSAESFTPGTAPTGYEAGNFARIVTTGQTLAGAYSILNQRIEDVRTLAGQTATVSFWAKAATGNPKIAVELEQKFGSGGSPSSDVQTYAGQVTLSTSWARHTLTVSVPSIAGKTIGSTANTSFIALKLWVSAGTAQNAFTGSLGIQSNTFDIWGVQLENGPVATPFRTATGTKQGELAACQRYYWRFYNESGSYGTIAYGRADSTTSAICPISFPVDMRQAPSTVEWSGNGAQYVLSQSITGISVIRSSKRQCSLYATGSSSLTTGQATLFTFGNDTTSYIGITAEL